MAETNKVAQFHIGITGATGFLGKQLMQHFIANGHHVSVLTRSPEKLNSYENIKIHVTDLSQPDSKILKAFTKDLDLLYHLAAELHRPAQIQAVNIEGTKALLQALDFSKTKLIHLSSIGIFDTKSDLITENSPKNPFNWYEKSKLEAEQLIETEREKGLKAVILRPSIVLGQYMKSSFLDQLYRLIRLGIDLKISQTVNTKVVLVDDLLRALILLGESNTANGENYNFSNDLPLKTLLAQLKSFSSSRIRFPLSGKLFQFILQLLRRLGLLSVSSESIAFFSSQSCVSNEKIRRELGFEFTEDYGPFLQEYVTCRS